MAVDWRLANPGGGFDYLESLMSLGNVEAQRQQNAARAYQMQEAQRVQQQRPTIAQRAQGGDLRGAQQDALAGGDFDYAEALGKLDESQLKRAGEEAGIMASVASNLRKAPQNERGVLLQSYLPALKATGHFSDEELSAAAADLSDGRLDGFIATGTSLKDRIDQQLRERTITETERHNRINETRPIWDPSSGTLIYPSGSAPGAVTLPTPVGDSASPSLQRMVDITLQSESGNRDYAPNGQPLTSSAGAVGRMQVMPGTNTDPGFGVRPAQDASMEERARVGRDYLGAMLQRYGNPSQAWAAYNAGPGRVDQAIRQGGENWLSLLPAETQAYVQKNVAQLGGGQSPQAPGTFQVRPPRREAPPSGYRWKADGTQEPIPGGPADPKVAGGRNPSANRRAESDFRKEFNALPEVKSFNKARPQFQNLRNLATKENPSAADDIALIFAYMKTLDPDSVVREGEFATAQNAGSVPERVWNIYNRAIEGTRLNPSQRVDMAKAALSQYSALRDAYNQQADLYRGYAEDNGVSPDRVARKYVIAPRAKKNDRRTQFRIVR